jgi:hypothetical protein
MLESGVVESVMLKRWGPDVDDGAGSPRNISAFGWNHEGAGLLRPAASVTCTSNVGKDFLTLLPDLNREEKNVFLPRNHTYVSPDDLP